MSYLSGNKKILRLIVFSIGLLAVFTGPSWLVLVAIVALALRWAAWEVLILGALVDLLWLPHGSFFHALPLFSFTALVLLWGLGPLRKELLV